MLRTVGGPIPSASKFPVAEQVIHAPLPVFTEYVWVGIMTQLVAFRGPPTCCLDYMVCEHLGLGAHSGSVLVSPAAHAAAAAVVAGTECEATDYSWGFGENSYFYEYTCTDSTTSGGRRRLAVRSA